MVELMRGFPPAPESRVTLANWRTPPFNRWAFRHVRELIPTADIPSATGAAWAFAEDPIDLDDLKIDHGDGTGDSLADILEQTYTDGIVVLHRGRLAYERYAEGMSVETPHILMSVSKSMLGLLTGVLAARGEIDPARAIVDLVPELAGTAYDDATIRDLLDMRVAVDFDEDYQATSGPMIAYRKATGWNPLEPGEQPSDLRAFFRQLTGHSNARGDAFNYVSPNTDLLGWIIERATDRRYADLMSHLLWQPLGAERSAYITVDRLGAPRCAGGMCTTTRDLARVGQLIVEGGRRDGNEIVPADWLDDIEHNGDAAAWNRGSFVDLFSGLPIHYRSQWYAKSGATPFLFAFGIHGQYLIVDARNEIVIAKVSSEPVPLDAERIALTMRAFDQLIGRLAEG